MANITSIEHYTNYWIRAKGINKRALESHPQIDDIILMLKVKDELWHIFNHSEQDIWNTYWHKVYLKNKPLHTKALKKLEQMTLTSIQRQNKIIEQRQLIKAMRLKYSKPADNMTAKDAGPLQSVPWD